MNAFYTIWLEHLNPISVMHSKHFTKSLNQSQNPPQSKSLIKPDIIIVVNKTNKELDLCYVCFHCI